ncbi:hypothetical protein FQN49_008861, partial [Arthroderma sp. PD_2]
PITRDESFPFGPKEAHNHPDNHFDSVVVAWALDGVNDLEEPIREIARVTNSASPDAKIVIIQAAPDNDLIKQVNVACPTACEKADNKAPMHHGLVLHRAAEILRTNGFSNIELIRIAESACHFEEEDLKARCQNAASLIVQMYYDGEDVQRMQSVLIPGMDSIFKETPHDIGTRQNATPLIDRFTKSQYKRHHLKMSSVPRVLLLGGHGKIALLLTPLLLARGWDVISAIRDPRHESDILKFNKDDGKGGKVSISISDLEKVKSSEDAAKVITAASPDYVVWAAGAGGKGPVERTYAIDQEAAKHFIHAALSKPNITKFLLISHIGSRRKPAPWWTAADGESVDRTKAALPDYYKAKLDADEYFSVITAQRKDKGDTNFQGINLRPTTLSDDPATKKVEFGRT